VPTAGITAIVQDLVLLAWCWLVVNVCRSTDGLRIIVRTWAYSSIVWAALLFFALATNTAALSGRTAKDASRTMLTFGDPNVCANYIFISIMIIWASQRPRRAPYRIGAYALLIAALVTTGSNSGILSLLIGGTVAASEFGEGLLLIVVFAGPVAAVLLWLIIVRRGDLLVDARTNDPWWWRLTASPAGLLIEQHNRDGAASSRKFYPRENIRDLTVDRNAARDHEIRDEHEVCIYAPPPHREPVRYFAVRRGEGEMIVSAIREGLEL
jgi:hypothetical protein